MISSSVFIVNLHRRKCFSQRNSEFQMMVITTGSSRPLIQIRIAQKQEGKKHTLTHTHAHKHANITFNICSIIFLLIIWMIYIFCFATVSIQRQWLGGLGRWHFVAKVVSTISFSFGRWFLLSVGVLLSMMSLGCACTSILQAFALHLPA